MSMSNLSGVPTMSVVESLRKEMPASDVERFNQIQDDEELDFTRNPPTPTPEMFPGIIGDTVEAVTKDTEAVPASVAVNIFSTLGATVGRPSKRTPDAPVFYIGDSDIHCNVSFLITGDTSKGRKGTSDKPVTNFRMLRTPTSVGIGTIDQIRPFLTAR